MLLINARASLALKDSFQTIFFNLEFQEQRFTQSVQYQPTRTENITNAISDVADINASSVSFDAIQSPSLSNLKQSLFNF